MSIRKGTLWAGVVAGGAVLLAAFPGTAGAEGGAALLEGGAKVLEGVESLPDRAPDTPASEAAPPLAVTPDLCARIALDGNPRSTLAEEKVRGAAEAAAAVRAQRLPRVGTSAGYTYVSGLETEIYGSQLAKLLFQVDGFEAQKGTFTTQVAVEQVLFSGGQIRAGIRASEFLAQSEEWKAEAERIALAAEARTACYDAMLAQAMVRVAGESVEAFRRHLQDARNRLDQGVASEFEVLRAETELKAREADAESARTAEQLAFVNLRRVLFLEDSRAVTVTGEIPWDPLDTPVETLVARALAGRPELAALDKGIEAARQNVLMKRGAYYPKAAATVQYQQVDGGGKLMPDGFTLGLGAEWEFWPGGKRKHELREAESQARQLELQRSGVARLVETDVRQAHARALEAVAKIKREKAAANLGAEGLELAELRFQEGAGIQAETLDAELALTTARTGLAKALRDYAVALTDLERALGQGLPEAPKAEE